jgi:DNA-binding NarL/FixJ family response regulator
MRSVRILIADDHEITRIGIKSFLATNPDYEVCAEAVDGRSIVEQTRRLNPDLVIIDVGLPKLDGLQAARQIMSGSFRPGIVIFTEIDSEEIMRESLELGIGGFVLKSDPLSDLMAAAEAVLQGRTFFTSRMMHIIINLANKQIRERILTCREQEIVQLLAEGYCSKEIARALHISVFTVETHRSKLMRKINVHSVAQLVLYAIRNEIVHLNRPNPLQIDEYESNGDYFQSAPVESPSEHPLTFAVRSPV